MRLQCAVMCILVVYIEQISSRHAKIDPTDEDMLLFWKRTNAVKCKPFTTFKIDCNQCVCAADGVSSCTRMDCGKRSEEKRRKELRKHAKQDYDTEETDESV